MVMLYMVRVSFMEAHHGAPGRPHGFPKIGVKSGVSAVSVLVYGLCTLELSI